MVNTRHDYDEKLDALRRSIYDMGVKVGQSLRDAIQALAAQDAALARRVMDGDDLIDAMEVVIEDQCILLIARQQPLARDLRVVGTGLKISTDLERVGDHAHDIAKIAISLTGEPLIKPLIDLPRMVDMAQKMLEESLAAYVDLDVALAQQVIAADDAVDQLYEELFHELSGFMKEDPSTIRQATLLIFVARYLERVADHATNIAEWVIYLVTAQRIRKRLE